MFYKNILTISNELKTINYCLLNIDNYCSKYKTTHNPVNLCNCGQNAI